MCQTVVGGMWVSKLVLRTDFFGLCNIFLRTRSTVSSDVFWSSRSFSCAQTTFFIIFLLCPNLHCCWRLFLETPSQMHAAQSCSTMTEHAPTHKTPFHSSECHLYICRDKNIKHQILACLATCCQNEKKFELEFA